MIRFYLILIIEIVFYPFILLSEEINKKINLCPLKLQAQRKKANSNKLVVGIHDWAGYDIKRKKKFKNNKVIDCGLHYQINRFENYRGNKNIEYTITISDADKFDKEKYNNLSINEVSNIGFDFAGYAQFIENLPVENTYVLLMNTSVERTDEPFIDEYIEFMENNPHVGVLGISYSTKIFQTLIRNNFTPHVQSFFLLSTTSVFREIVEYNNGFPGKDISYKRLLIRNGEVRLSKIIQKLGYSLAIINEDGQPYVFPQSNGVLDTSYKKWGMPNGDYRYAVKVPNKINKLR